MQLGARCPLKLGSHPVTEPGTQGHYPFWCSHFKEMALKSLRKTFLDLKPGKGLPCFAKDWHTFQKDGERTYTYKFSKLNALGKGKVKEVSFPFVPGIFFSFLKLYLPLHGLYSIVCNLLYIVTSTHCLVHIISPN